MYKPKPSTYSFQSADPFLEELLNKRARDDQAAASYVPKPKEKPAPKAPGFAMTPPPSVPETPKAPAPAPSAPAASTASTDSGSSSSYDLRRMAARDFAKAELDAFAQRESQGYRVDPLSRQRASERLRNTLAGIDAEERRSSKSKALREGTMRPGAESRAAKDQANKARPLAAGPSGTARPQSTQAAPPVKSSGPYLGVPEGYDLTPEQLNLVGDDTLYGTSPDGRRFYLNPGEKPVYLDGRPAPLSVARRPAPEPFVYQDPRRFTNETPEGRLRNAGVLTPTGELNLEATDYGRQARLAEERARTDALYQKLLADDVARNPSNDPGLWDSSRRDPADPRGAGVPRSDPAALTQNMPSYEADRIAARNKKLNDLDSQHRLGYPHPDTSRAIGGRATATNDASPIRGLDPGTPSDWPSIVPDEWPAAPAAPGVPSMLSPPDDRGTPPFLDRPGVPFLLEPNDSLPEYLARRSSPIGSARRSLRQTPQRQLMDLADFTPPLRYGSR
jgi:hypothetical protein